MSTKQSVGQIRSIIEEMKLKGVVAINCDNLIAYLKEIEHSPEAEPSQYEIEKYKADLSNWGAAYNYTLDTNLELFRSVITAGQNSIKTSFLLNGGAAIALLAFIGHLTEIKSAQVHDFACGLIPFSLGVLATTITSGLTYLCQWLYASGHAQARKSGEWVNILAIIVGAAAYLFFLWGLCSAYRALESL